MNMTMNLIEKWKTRETKKKLREENTKLKTEIKMLHKIPKSPVCTVERNVQRIRAEMAFHIGENIPMETIKNILLNDLKKRLPQFVEYDFEDGTNGDRIFAVNLYVVIGDRKYGS